MISAARKAGDYRSLYPRGVKNIHDVPWPLQEAIGHGLTVLSWFENYTGEEIPNQNLWDDGEYTEAHFKAVMEKKWGGGGGSAYSSAEDSSDDMTGNDLASVFKQ